MIYEYQCLSCGEIIPIKHPITNPARTLLYCPTCKRMRFVKRLISKTSFVLKGGAWAKDGYTKEKTCQTTQK
ncbi:hypothetical protein KA005_19225 [bacterium]|nr:hypothetical protein [bacterium]